MRDKAWEIKTAKAYLPVEANETLLEICIEKWYSAASAIMRLRANEDMPKGTLYQVIENAVASYNANGDEGLVGSSTGGQSYTYDDLYKRLLTVAVSERSPRL